MLGASTLFDAVSLRGSAGQMVFRARRFGRPVFEMSRVTSDVTLWAVFLEEVVSVSGDLIALAALGLI